MKKFCIITCGIYMTFAAFGAGENVPTSKAYVDTEIAKKQDKIAANSGATQILMNTGTPGSVGTKNIYDSTASYGTQTESLVTAGDFNTAVQNAIDSEFECVGWNPNDSNDCWFVKIRGVTDKPSGKNLLEPSFMDNSTYGPITVNGHSYFAGRILPTENGKTYTLSANLTYTGDFYYYFDKVLPDGTLVECNSASSPCRYMWASVNDTVGAWRGRPCTFTASDNATYVVYVAGSYNNVRRTINHFTLSNYQMEEGSVATAYEPYQNLYLPSGN